MDQLIGLLNKKLLAKGHYQLSNNQQQVQRPIDYSQVTFLEPPNQLINQINTKVQSQLIQKVREKNRVKQKQRQIEKPNRSKITAPLLAKLRTKFQQYQDQKFQQFSSLGKKKRSQTISFTSIGIQTNLAASSVKNLYAEYQHDPLFTIRMQRLRSTKGNVIRKYSGRLSKMRIQFIEQLLQENPFRIKKQIAQQMNKHPQLLKLKQDGTRIPISISTIKKLQDSAGYSRRKAIRKTDNRNTPESIERRYYFCLKYQKQRQNGLQPFFLSQTKFNIFALRDIGYTKINQQLKISPHSTQSRPVADVDLIVISGKENSLMDWKAVKVSQNNEEILLQFLDQALGKIANVVQKKKMLVFQQHFPFCNKQQAINIIFKHNFSILHLPPQSPLLNPIDYWFHELRSKIRRRCYINDDLLIQEIKHVIQSYKTSAMETFYEAADKYVEQSLKRNIIR